MSERAGTLALILLVAAAYATAAFGTFQYDDFNVVVGNAAVHGTAAWLASMPGIRPLTKLSYAVNWTIDPGPTGFVAFNVACHLTSALLVLALARRWIAALASACPRAGWAAFVTALVFALHPAQTEAVTYIAGRSVSLAACIYLVALLAWEQHREAPARGGRLALSVIGLALALLARETALTLPFAILLVERARGTRWREALLSLRWHAIVLGVAALAAIGSPTYRRLLRTSVDVRGPLENLSAQVDAIAYLVTRPLLTLRVNIDPEVVEGPFDAAWIVTAGLLVVSVAIGVASLRTRPWLGFAILWFFLHLVPTNGPIARLDLANDRQLYLALVGPALAFGVWSGGWRTRRIADAAVVMLAALLLVATLVRNFDYRSEIALWQATTAVSPARSRVWNNLGMAHRAAGDVLRARQAFRRAVEIDADDYKARQNLRDLD